jgi:asparagine synthase (glutamine-hydrolysing)
MLDGEGGDELFGLAPYLIADMLCAGRLPTAWSLTAQIPGMGLYPDRDLRIRVLRRYGLSPLVPSTVQRRREARRNRACTNSIVPRADAQALTELLTCRTDRRDGPLWWRFQAESLIEERDMLDVGGHFRREAIDEGVQRRHPFLYDLRLTEAALALPPRPRFDPVRDRPLLREALRGAIPEAVRTRHAKSHFTSLVLAGMRAEEDGLIEPLGRADAPVRAYVTRDGLERKLGVTPEDRSILGAASLWRLAIANRWLMAQTANRA